MTTTISTRNAAQAFDGGEFEIDTDYILDGTLTIDYSAERVEG